MATHPSILAWEIPWTDALGKLQIQGVTKQLDTTWQLNNNRISNRYFHISMDGNYFAAFKSMWCVKEISGPPAWQLTGKLPFRNVVSQHLLFSPNLQVWSRHLNFVCYGLIAVMSDSCQPLDYSPPGSSVHRILQARILEWIAISFSRGSFQPRDRTWVSCIAGRFFTICATREAHIICI